MRQVWLILALGVGEVGLGTASYASSAAYTPEALHAPAASWPAGEGGAIAQSKCLICHNAEIIQAQRLKPAQWQAEVTKMTKWGAPLTPKEQQTLALWLASHYGPEAAVVTPPTVHFGD